MRVFTAEFSNSSSRTGLQFSLCALRLLGLQLHGYTCTHGRQKSAIAIFGVGQVCGSEEGTNVRRLRQRIDIPCNLRHVCRRSAAACLHSVSGSARRRRVHIMLINLSPVPVPVHGPRDCNPESRGLCLCLPGSGFHGPHAPQVLVVGRFVFLCCSLG